MSLKQRSLGSITGAATSGITISAGTNATPIVATLGAGHGQVNGDRVHISGVTGNTGCNGEWTLEFTGANTAKLLGSKGNGVFAGTAVVSAVCDVTPFQSNHRVLGAINGNISVGTMEIEGHPGDESSAGVLDTAKWVKASITSDATVLPDTTPGSSVEVKLYKFMRAKAVAAITGTAKVNLIG